jgi:HlyD family secretion protein
LQASLESSKARLSAARAVVRDAMVSQEERKAVYERRKSLQTHNAASAQDVDTARAAYERAIVAIEAAQANVEMSEAQLRLDETNLARARIVSPIDGVVLMRKVDPGQTVASSLQAPVLFTIAEDLRRMEIQVDVDEADVGRVKESQTALFTVDAYPNRKFPAQIRMVRFGSEVVQGVVTYKAVLTTDNGDLSLRPGMTATAEVVVEQIRNALTVPNQALRFQMPQQNNRVQGQSWLSRLLPRSGPPQFRPPSAQRSTAAAGRIFVLRDRQPVAVRVAVGPSDGQVTQIVRGEIAEGDSVIIDATQRRR